MTKSRPRDGVAPIARAAFVLLLLAGFAGPVLAFQPNVKDRCIKDNGPIPSFATRDAQGCIVIDPGNGRPPIRFSNDYVGPPGRSLGSTGALISPYIQACDTDGNDCALFVYRLDLDDYLDTSGEADVWQLNARPGFRYTLMKDTNLGNTVQCKGGAWVGPNGIRSCTAGQSSSAHLDVLQTQCWNEQPEGWAVFQDVKLLNTEMQHTHLQNLGLCSGKQQGSMVWQGVRVGYEPDYGSATDWLADCAKRQNRTQCFKGTAPRWSMSQDLKVIWFIDSWTEVPVWIFRADKVIVVNTGCNNTSGCNGTRGFTKGWPDPIGGTAISSGPGTCPNGLIAPPGNLLKEPATDDTPNGPDVYCYTSIEAALADAPTGATARVGECPSRSCPHERPPFIGLSPAGWGNRAGGEIPPPTDDTPPAAPVLLE